VNESTLELAKKQDPNTFGEAYACFMKKNKFHPTERSDIKYISDPEMSFVMLRYRQVFHLQF